MLQFQKPLNFEMKDSGIWKPYIQVSEHKRIRSMLVPISIILFILFFHATNFLGRIESYFLPEPAQFWQSIIVDIIIFTIIIFIHELLHIVVVISKGDVSITLTKTTVYVNSSAELTFTRRIIFQVLPLIILTCGALLASLFTNGIVKDLLVLTGISNFIMSYLDILSLCYLLKIPRNTVFYGSLYRINE